MFDNPEIFYFKNPFQIFDSNWLLDHYKISKLKEYKLVVADFGSEHYGIHGLDHVYHALDQQNVNFLLLTHEPADHQKLPRLFFYNHWYHFSQKNLNKIIPHDNRHYMWSCLNGNPRPHRIYNFLYSRQQEYFSKCYFSIQNDDEYEPRNDDIQLDSEMQQQWNDIKYTLPVITNLRWTNIDIPAFTDSYIHLVTETTIIPKIFITEKTWKPIASAQLFLIFGNPGTVKFLRSVGVDVFDDIINHDYDQDLDWKSRLFKIHREIEKLCNAGISSQWQATQQRRLLNSQRFWSNDFDCNYSKDIKQAIDQYLK